ncbi:hypothetical protein C0Q70_17114 [Pomacea canaliculata]|uniref:Annexin n=1 Tax=Pomacea canaliculata TaxID=400727 RepID=A0A2T7NRN6_POMCA|nr:hypothetical protein C0Q70_17114 [Pomacea canaliculata]
MTTPRAWLLTGKDGLQMRVKLDPGTFPQIARPRQVSQTLAQLSVDLIDDLKSELGGDLEEVCIALMTPPRTFDARQINKAIKGIGTDETTLVEILTTRTNAEINEIKKRYKEGKYGYTTERMKFGCDLEDDLQSDTSGYFSRLMVSLCAAGRQSDDWGADEHKAEEDAKRFFEAGEARWGTEEAELNAILCLRSPGQLKKMFERFEHLTGHPIEESIKSECSGSLQEGYLAIVESVKSKPRYFARRLNESMAGIGTNDNDLIRIIVSRSEIDLEDIKKEFARLYGKSLAEAITSECSGDYKKMLLSVLDPSHN